MGEYIRNFIAGMGSAFEIFPDSQYQVPTKGGFQRDSEALRHDAEAIARDMVKTAKKIPELAHAK